MFGNFDSFGASREFLTTASNRIPSPEMPMILEDDHVIRNLMMEKALDTLSKSLDNISKSLDVVSKTLDVLSKNFGC